jgi:hypothetical protein
MTIKHVVFIAILFSTTILIGQDFNKKYFTKTKWFSNNIDSTYYHSDTIKLIKYTTLVQPGWSNKKDYAEYEMKYLKHGDFVVITLDRHGKMNYYERYQNYIGLVGTEKWSWEFNNKSSNLDFYKNGQLSSSFRPLSERQINIESKYAEQKSPLITTELTLVRVK